MSCGKFKDDPGKQTAPFAEDPADTIIQDPIGGVAVSEEWKHPDPQVEAPIEDAQAARWQEHSYDIEDTDTKQFVEGECIEIARWSAPPGTQGRVSVVETAVLKIPETGPPFSFACSCPWYYEYFNAFADPVTLGFYLRLDSWRRLGLDPGPMIVNSADSLPGQPHPSLGEWHDARYDYARRNVHVSLFVPEGQYLRMFVEFKIQAPRTIFDRVWGRLAGITQHYRDNPSAEIESRKWPAG